MIFLFLAILPLIFSSSIRVINGTWSISYNNCPERLDNLFKIIYSNTSSDEIKFSHYSRSGEEDTGNCLILNSTVDCGNLITTLACDWSSTIFSRTDKPVNVMFFFFFFYF